MLLLPNPTVDAFALKISLPAGSGVLLDPVNPQLPDGDAVLPDPFAQIRTLGQHCIRGRLLASEIGECLVDKRLLSDHSFEVGITRPVQLRAAFPGKIQLRQSRSTSAIWRSSPSKDMNMYHMTTAQLGRDGRRKPTANGDVTSSRAPALRSRV